MREKIIVISDLPIDCFNLKNMLCEYIILTAVDKSEALLIIDDNSDITLAIFNLSSENEIELKKISEINEIIKSIPLIVLSNNIETNIEAMAMKLGAIDVIKRPFSKEILKGKIDFYIEFFQMKRFIENNPYENDNIWDAVFQQSPIGIAISNLSEANFVNCNNYIRINPVFEQITGRTKADIIKLGWTKITHPDDLNEDVENYKKLLAGEISNYRMEKRYIKPDGTVVWVYMVVAPIIYPKKELSKHICLIQDITRQKEIEKELKESQRSKEVFLSHLPGMAYRCSHDRKWTMEYVSDGCFELTGYLPNKLIQNKELSFNDIIDPEYRTLLWDKWKYIISQHQPFRYEYKIITASGEKKWVLELGQGIYNIQGDIEALEGIILDISDRKDIEDGLRYISEHDTLTGLNNYYFLENYLEKEINMNTLEKGVLIGINISTIHSLSVTYGVHYIQELIKKISDSLKEITNEKCQLFYHEHIFIFYFKSYIDKNELLSFCEIVESVLKDTIMGEGISIGTGIVEINKANQNQVDVLLKKIILSSEKSLERNSNFCFYDDEMEKQTIFDKNVKDALSKVISREKGCKLFLEYQAIFDLKTYKICGFEALSRVKSDELGIIPPFSFIPLAEKTKLIIPLGELIIRSAFNFINTLKSHGYESINISINLSAIQLLNKGFVKKLFEIMSEMNINPLNFGLELTESVFASNFQEINYVLGQLNNKGIKIAIDDFGTGYSSLARERELNVSCLKIDKYFIDKLMEIDHENAITGDIISMAHKLGHCVIAEGIEYEEQREYLEKNNCDKIQGYLISKPVGEEAALDLLKKFSYNVATNSFL